MVRNAVANHPQASLIELADLIKRTTFKITRVGELVAREASRLLDAEMGIIDLSLAPTPAVGDSIAEILESMGLEMPGAPGTTAALAMLNDAVKKGGTMATSSTGRALRRLHPGDARTPRWRVPRPPASSPSRSSRP